MDRLLVYLQSRLTWGAAVEIIIIAFCIYKVLMWIRGTQAEQVAKGALVLIILVPLSNWLGFTTLNYLFNNLITWLVMIIVVVFQPEMRSALENLGNSNIFFGWLTRNKKSSKLEKDIHELASAVLELSRERIGALIVCERKTGLKDIVGTGILLNSDISTELLENIFTPNRPLHDGAVVINLYSGKILGAGCLLPLTEKTALDTDLGTRHRAGIGISEQSDAITLIVSEETGTISFTERGSLSRDLNGHEVEELLQACFIQDDDQEGENRRRHVFSRVLVPKTTQKGDEKE